MIAVYLGMFHSTSSHGLSFLSTVFYKAHQCGHKDEMAVTPPPFKKMNRKHLKWFLARSILSLIH